MACGLLGLRIKLHRTPEGVVFPAYRAASLCCALGPLLRAGGPSLVWLGCGSPRPGHRAVGLRRGLPACMWPMACRGLGSSCLASPRSQLVCVSQITNGVPNEPVFHGYACPFCPHPAYALSR